MSEQTVLTDRDRCRILIILVGRGTAYDNAAKAAQSFTDLDQLRELLDLVEFGIPFGPALALITGEMRDPMMEALDEYRESRR